jgi:hypothetical protein
VSYKAIFNADIEQGDIIEGVYVITKVPGQEASDISNNKAMVFVLSHNCEIDKPANEERRSDRVLVACVYKASSLSKGDLKLLKDGRIVNAFYIPKDDPLNEDYYIDWRTVQPVDKNTLLSARKDDKLYICTLDGELYEQACGLFWDFLFRPRPSPDRA